LNFGDDLVGDVIQSDTSGGSALVIMFEIRTASLGLGQTNWSPNIAQTGARFGRIEEVRVPFSQYWLLLELLL